MNKACYIALCFVLAFLLTCYKSYANSSLGAYIQNFNGSSGDFKQTNPDGSNSRGVFCFNSPRKIRWEYTYPRAIVVILNGNVVTYHDRELEETSHKVFGRDNNVLMLLDSVSDTMPDKATITKEGNIMFVEQYQDHEVSVFFGAMPIALEKMTLLDKNNDKTSITFHKIRYNQKFVKNIFTEF